MLQQLFKKKPLNQLMDEAHMEHGLRRALTSFNLVTLGIGAIIGTGIFVLLGDRKSTRLNSSHRPLSRMPSSA